MDLCEVVILESIMHIVLNHFLKCWNGLGVFCQNIFIFIYGLLKLVPICLIVLNEVLIFKEAIIRSELEHDSWFWICRFCSSILFFLRHCLDRLFQVLGCETFLYGLLLFGEICLQIWINLKGAWRWDICCITQHIYLRHLIWTLAGEINIKLSCFEAIFFGKWCKLTN